MKKLVATFFLLLFITFKTVACQCEGPSDDIEKNWKESHSIFIGKVLEESSDKLFLAGGINYTYYTIQVISPIKGSFHPKFNKRTFEKISHGSCDYNFEVGKNYLIYSYYNNGKLVTDICSRTAPLNEVKENEIKELKRFTELYGQDDVPLILEQSIAERELEVTKGKIKKLVNINNWLIGASITLCLLSFILVFILVKRSIGRRNRG